ncbi:MAG: ECF-type sigma factor [Planctomycetaceae bacterium]
MSTPEPSRSRSWIGALKAGDEQAAQHLFERYFRQLVALARAKLGGVPSRVRDEEDVALSALNSFFLRARENAFPCLNDHDDLWRLLVVFTARKASHLRRYRTAQKRGGGTVRGDSVGISDGRDDFQGLNYVLDEQPTPEIAAIFAEELDHRLNGLNDDVLMRIACLKLQGFRTTEIAAELGRTPRTVERKLELIREIWREQP